MLGETTIKKILQSIMPRKLLGPLELSNSVNHRRNPYQYQRLHQKIEEEWTDLKIEGLHSTFDYNSESPSLKRFRHQQEEGNSSTLPYYRKGRMPSSSTQYMTKQDKLNYLKEVYQLTGLVAPKIGDQTRFNKSEEKRRQQTKFLSGTGKDQRERDLYEESRFAGPCAPWGSSYFDPFPEKAEHHHNAENVSQITRSQENDHLASSSILLKDAPLNKNQIEDQLRDTFQQSQYINVVNLTNQHNEYQVKKYRLTKDKALKERLFASGKRGPLPAEAHLPQPTSGIGLNFNFDNRWSTVHREQYRPMTAPPDMSKSKEIRNRYGEMTKYADLPQKRAELSSFKLRNYKKIKWNYKSLA